MQLTGHGRSDNNIDRRIPNIDVGGPRVWDDLGEWLRVVVHQGCVNRHGDIAQVLAMSYDVEESGECGRWWDQPTSPTPNPEFLELRI